MIIAILLTTFMLHAKTNLFTAPTPTPTPVQTKPSKVQPLPPPDSLNIQKSATLPIEYFRNKDRISIEESPIITPAAPQKLTYAKIKVTDVVQAEIQESLFAFYDSKVPVRAIIKSKDLRDCILLGEATLEKNSKRILINFKKVRTANNELYVLAAVGLDSQGILGIEGKLISNEGKFFTAEMITALAEGYLDSTIERKENILGNSTEENTTDTHAKKAAGRALSKTGEFFADKLKSNPEYSILTGPISIQVLITEEAKKSND